MSETEETTTERPTEPTHECATCGRNGYYGDICGECHRPITEVRQYTLSEERSGRAPDDGRYTRTGFVGPKIVDVPGSTGPGSSE